MASHFLPVALLVLLLGCTASAEVVSLTDATFADKVKEKDTVWFIKFFAPWCGHCKRLAPTWEQLGAALEGEDGVEVAHVDCTTSKDTCSKADIRSYPTLKLYYNGEEYKKYSGTRDLESLKKFAIEAAAELVKEANEGEQSYIM
ncbi:hypothetical protein Mapa_009235 [Marchantia paleacea]|nr:hypothetical protein Mapa_009235 [Marchantia paleacea]